MRRHVEKIRMMKRIDAGLDDFEKRTSLSSSDLNGLETENEVIEEVVEEVVVASPEATPQDVLVAAPAPLPVMTTASSSTPSVFKYDPNEDLTRRYNAVKSIDLENGEAELYFDRPGAGASQANPKVLPLRAGSAVAILT